MRSHNDPQRAAFFDSAYFVYSFSFLMHGRGTIDFEPEEKSIPIDYNKIKLNLNRNQSRLASEPIKQLERKFKLCIQHTRLVFTKPKNLNNPLKIFLVTNSWKSKLHFAFVRSTCILNHPLITARIVFFCKNKMAVDSCRLF